MASVSAFIARVVYLAQSASASASEAAIGQEVGATFSGMRVQYIIKI